MGPCVIGIPTNVVGETMPKTNLQGVIRRCIDIRNVVNAAKTRVRNCSSLRIEGVGKRCPRDVHLVISYIGDRQAHRLPQLILRGEVPLFGVKILGVWIHNEPSWTTRGESGQGRRKRKCQVRNLKASYRIRSHTVVDQNVPYFSAGAGTIK